MIIRYRAATKLQQIRDTAQRNPESRSEDNDNWLD